MPSIFSVCALLATASVALSQSSGATSAAFFTIAEPSVSSNGTSQPMVTVTLSLDEYWDLFVGPVVEASVNTTVVAEPVPSSSLVPPPPLYYAPFPGGAQNPLQSKNSSWSFPKDFWWGVSSAAYQVEGAVKDEGRGPSIWDVLTHRVTNYIAHNDTGDIADNEYYLYKQDIARIAAMGVKTYSFSISWNRIFPFGSGQVNEQGLKHYDDVIQTCLDYDVTPMVTLYHWDLPLALQNSYGGWLSDKIVHDFTEYARVAFTRWSSKVSHWYTFNEPIVFCGLYPLPANYFKATTIPAKQQPYVCGHNVLLSHASAYHVAKSIAPNATITIKTNGGYKIPLTNSSADTTATQRAWDFNEGWFANPCFINGDYPPALKSYVSDFLPAFTTAQKSALNNSCDFFAHDAYTSQFYMAPDAGIDACTSNSSHPLYPGCYNSTYAYVSGWLVGPAADPGSPWLHKATDWVPAFLHYIHDTWKPRGGIAVTEFGFAEPFEAQKTVRADILSDAVRSAYYRDYLEAILIAMSEGVNVIGCLAWSLVDNLEWASGYTVKFGMQYVNLTTQERFYKASFFEFVNAFKLYQDQ